MLSITWKSVPVVPITISTTNQIDEENNENSEEISVIEESQIQRVTKSIGREIHKIITII